MLNMKKALTKILTAIKGTEKMVLLWTNASPTSAFASQDISIDLSAYSKALITFDNGSVLIIDIGQEIGKFSVTGNINYRRIVTYSYKIFFDSGYTYNGYGGVSGQVWNNVMKPLKIYGIKEN